MSLKENNGCYELRSGEAALTCIPAENGRYRVAYTVAGRPVFTVPSFSGGNFQLLIDRVAPDEIHLAGLQLGGQWHSAGQTGSWTGQARSLTANPGWFRLTAAISLAETLRLARADQAPAWAFSLAEPRSAAQVSLVSQPTGHNPPVAWLRSNDLPAAYLWDEPTGTETIIFPDLGNCDWFQRDGLNRLADYHTTLDADCQTFGFLLRPDSAQRAATIPAGTYNLSCWFFLGQKAVKPDAWQAVRNLIEGCAALLPGAPAVTPPENISWLDLERRGREELMLPGICWLEDKVRGYVAYVQEPSQLARNGGPLDERLEAMASLDVLPPWLAALRLWPDPAQQAHLLKVAAALAHHYSPEHRIFVNQVDLHSGLPLVKHPQTQVGPAYGDSWYFFEPLLRLGWCAHLTPPGEVALNLQQIFLVSCQRAIEFIRKHNYHPAAFYDPLTLAPFNYPIPAGAEDPEIEFWHATVPAGSKPWLNWLNTSQNWACLGLYAYIMLQAHAISGEVTFRQEALRALDTLSDCPPETLFWEPFEISYAVAAAALTGKNDLAANLAANLLRMGYWHDETGLPGPVRPRRGLFQAWAGIRYPAQKENGETLLPLLAWLRRAGLSTEQPVITAILKFFNLARASALYHYSPALREDEVYPGRLPTPAPHIPFEDLEMFEWFAPMHINTFQAMPPTGQASGALGREIYGAGETTWFALMFEALAGSSDPTVMLLNLDLFDWELMADFPRHREQSFILYNPGDPVNVAVNFKALQPGEKYRVRHGQETALAVPDETGHYTLRNLALAKDEWLRIELLFQGEFSNDLPGESGNKFKRDLANSGF
jgi:hypothetical protein